MHESDLIDFCTYTFCSISQACCHHEFKGMHFSHFSKYNFKKIYHNIINTPLQNSFVLPLACVTYTIKEQGVGQEKHLIIDEFILMFFLLYGTYMECPGLNKLRDQGQLGNGWIKNKMTQRAADFWNGNVWDQWKEKRPQFATFVDNYPKDSVCIEIVPTADQN